MLVVGRNAAAMGESSNWSHIIESLRSDDMVVAVGVTAMEEVPSGSYLVRMCRAKE